ARRRRAGEGCLARSAAIAMTTPIGRLVKAADQVAGGDLDARVDNAEAPAELIVLSEAFNRMTQDIKTQQAALKTASDEAQARSLFIETVLSGVSAGVIGLDRKRRISAINDSASYLLGLDADQVQG